MHRRSRIALSSIAISLFLLAIYASLAAATGPLQLDTGFGKRGLVTDPEAPSGFGRVKAMAVAPGRTIYVAAESAAEPGTVVIAHYWRGGELERSFGTRGYLTLPGFGRVDALAADGSGRLLVLSRGTTITRIAGGRLDPSFGNGGSVKMAALGLESFRLWSLAALPGGAVAAAGGNQVGGVSGLVEQMAAVKLRPDGTLDTSFNGTGSRVVGFFPETYSSALQIKAQGDGKLVLAGYAGARPALARLLPDGRLDSDFGSDGQVVSPHRLRGSIGALTIRRDGGILAGASGLTSRRVGGRALLLRYASDGALDRHFGAIAAPGSRSDLVAVPIAVMRARRHIFLVTRRHGPAIRAYRLNGEPLHLGQVPGVPRDIYALLAAAPQDRKLVIAWTPKDSLPQGGVVHLARFVVR
jgi:uncharacterized delta-60 repeat protein